VGGANEVQYAHDVSSRSLDHPRRSGAVSEPFPFNNAVPSECGRALYECADRVTQPRQVLRNGSRGNIRKRSTVNRSLVTLALATLIAAPAAAQTVRVGVTAGPHAQILEQVVPEAKKLGLDVKVVEFTDYVIPNQALAGKDIEINSFQHEPYLKNQLAKTGWKLVKVASTIASPMGFYSKKYKSFADVPAGATVAIQNDPTNGARSLRLLSDNGLIKLRDPASITAGVIDIVDNPKKFKFVELDAAQLPRSLPDVDVAAVNNNYAVQAGLDPVRDSIVKETDDGPWVNIIAVREEDKDKPWVKTFVDAYHSASVKQFIIDKFKGAYAAAW
jgi:D-methionine transport system substrate-binding protein